jgi:hypothetical protein
MQSGRVLTSPCATMTAVTGPSWRPIRGLRSDPPGLAAEPERRGVFAAALQQAEEFFDAACETGYATKPVALFYALSQAGRAIAAAWGQEDRWELAGHGLSVPMQRERSGLPGIAESPIKVTPREADSFGAVARLTGSATLPAGTIVQLGALWASLPELPPVDELCADHWRAREITPAQDRPGRLLFGAPPLSGPTMGTVSLPELADRDDPREADAAEVLRPYPTASGAAIQIVPKREERDPSRVVPAGLLDWTRREPGPVGGHINVVSPLDRHAVEVGGRFYLRPSVGSDSTYLSTLMTWWALLFALSSIARYEPAAWTTALDVDASPIGNALEDALDEAEARLPHLIIEALVRRPLPGAIVL